MVESLSSKSTLIYVLCSDQTEKSLSDLDHNRIQPVYKYFSMLSMDKKYNRRTMKWERENILKLVVIWWIIKAYQSRTFKSTPAQFITFVKLRCTMLHWAATAAVLRKRKDILKLVIIFDELSEQITNLRYAMSVD